MSRFYYNIIVKSTTSLIILICEKLSLCYSDVEILSSWGEDKRTKGQPLILKSGLNFNSLDRIPKRRKTECLQSVFDKRKILKHVCQLVNK